MLGCAQFQKAHKEKQPFFRVCMCKQTHICDNYQRSLPRMIWRICVKLTEGENLREWRYSLPPSFNPTPKAYQLQNHSPRLNYLVSREQTLTNPHGGACRHAPIFCRSRGGWFGGSMSLAVAGAPPCWPRSPPTPGWRASGCTCAPKRLRTTCLQWNNGAADEFHYQSHGMFCCLFIVFSKKHGQQVTSGQVMFQTHAET